MGVTMGGAMPLAVAAIGSSSTAAWRARGRVGAALAVVVSGAARSAVVASAGSDTALANGMLWRDGVRRCAWLRCATSRVLLPAGGGVGAPDRWVDVAVGVGVGSRVGKAAPAVCEVLGALLVAGHAVPSGAGSDADACSDIDTGADTGAGAGAGATTALDVASGGEGDVVAAASGAASAMAGSSSWTAGTGGGDWASGEAVWSVIREGSGA